MSDKARIVVLGMMGRTPFAGVAWQMLHYLEGFRRIGCDVYYIEDTGDWPYDPVQNAITADPGYTINYIAQMMEWCGLPDRWAYRAQAEEGRTYCLSDSQLSLLFEQADALINLTGATVLREEHHRVPVRVYLETDYKSVYLAEREEEVLTLTDPRIRQSVQELEIRLASYADYAAALPV
jgi:hypothetical protein